MKINLKDGVPVQATYSPIPRQLYKELKHYVEDLLNKECIRHSDSLYYLSVVVDRKKDGTFSLCCDYCNLTAKTEPDNHHSFRMQTVIFNLGGDQYFTLLDLIKAYHQKYISPGSRKLTGFITPWDFYE